MKRKLLILTGCLFLFGAGVHGQAPVADFTANITSGCAPLIVTFKDLSTNSPTSWTWDFGNGFTSSYQNPSSNYYSAGTYPVTLIVKNASGADAIRKIGFITVYPTPTAKFGVNLNTACAPATIQFIDYSLTGGGGSPIVSWVWNFDDGSGSNLETPSHVYTQTGYYNIGLTVTNSGGCSNSVTYPRSVRVINGIQPNFTWNQTGASCNAPYTLDFLNQTAGPGNLTYNWTLGSGATPATSAILNPTNVSYPAAGNYSVTLAVQSDLGCSQTITQTVPLSSGTPVISGPSVACLNSPNSFSNATTPAPLSSHWDFGDGTTSNSPTPTKTYTATGPFTVTLTNTFATCTSKTTQQITIGGSFVPVFSATPPGGCQAPLAVQFTDQTVPADAQSMWIFGDGSPNASGQTLSHTYAASGSYNVTLIATSATGCTDTVITTQAVNITAPTINITQSTGCIGSPVSPAYTVNAIDGVASYTWSAPGASPSAATGANPSFIYSTPGSYALTLTIMTNGSCTATQTISNVMQIGSPVMASFTATPAMACGSNPVTFSGTSTPVLGDHWIWTFGDGTIDSGMVVSHVFKKFGTLAVTLSVDNSGCTSFVTQNEIVGPPIPNFGYQVNCTANNPLVNNNLSVSFIDSTLHDANPLTYTWSFGDGGTIGPAPGPSAPTYIYLAPGSYPVTLTVIDNGCTASFTRTVTVANVTPSFNILVKNVIASQVCEDAPFTLSSTSVTVPFGTPNAGYTWNIGAISTPQASTYTLSLNTIGPYPVSLRVKDINGCLYTSPVSALVVKGPTAAFTAPTGNCINSPVTFTDNTILDPPGDSILNWGWNFGDGTPPQTFTAAPFTHLYADTGTFTVTVVAYDRTGCVNNSPAVTVQITNPRALFGPPDSFYCPNSPLTFIDSSQGYGLMETWTFGDGSMSGPNTTPPFGATHPYAASATPYQVTLSVKDIYGCINSETRSVLIQPPVASFTIADTTSICIPQETIFTATGQYYDSLYWNFGDGKFSTLDTTAHFYNTYDTFYAKLIVQGPGGCRDSASRRVLVLNPNTATTFTFTPETACDSIVAKFTIVPPGYTTFWLAFGDKQADSSGNATPVHTYRLPGSYTPVLTLTDATGCIVPLQDTILTVLGAVPFFTVTPPAFCDSGTVTFTDYTISNDGIRSKTYMFGDFTAPLSQPLPLTLSFDTTHYYNTPGMLLAVLNVVTDHNCTANYTDTIRVYQTPHPVIGTTGFLCAGLVQFQGTLNPPDADTITWAWNFGNGQTANVQNPLPVIQAGTWLVNLKASVSFGCNDTTSAAISINPDPVIKGPSVITTPVGVPVTIPFTYSSGVTTYDWTPASNLDCSTCANPTASLTLAQLYTVLVTDSNNCTDTASILIKTICNEGSYFLPNTFSPNGDGVNDYFYPRGNGIYNIQSMSIFNRWGQMVFQRQNFPPNSETMGWDGNFNGHPAPSDAYVYIVEVICNNAQVVALHGNVVLVR